MFLRPNHRGKDGKDHTYWSLVETVRTPDGPRQKTLCYLGELNSSAEARWLTTVEVFNQQGETQQLKLFPSHVEPPADDPQVARVLLNKVRLERTRQFGACFLGLELWKQLELDRFFELAVDGEPADVPWSRHMVLLTCFRLANKRAPHETIGQMLDECAVRPLALDLSRVSFEFCDGRDEGSKPGFLSVVSKHGRSNAVTIPSIRAFSSFSAAMLAESVSGTVTMRCLRNTPTYHTSAAIIVKYKASHDIVSFG